jgi:hypothetical protein
MHDHPRDCKKRGKEKIFPRLDARSPRIPGSCVPTAIHVFNRPDTLRLLVARTLNRRRFQFVHLDFVLSSCSMAEGALVGSSLWQRVYSWLLSWFYRYGRAAA